jgi:hypothetical protein
VPRIVTDLDGRDSRYPGALSSTSTEEFRRLGERYLSDTREWPAAQVQAACDQAKNGSARLAGIEPPRYADDEKTIAELKARIAKTVAFIKSVDGGKIDASADREITFPLGPKTGHMKGADYLNYFALPNFHFHLATAYDILRHCGVEIGKPDYLGNMPIRIT